MHDTSSRRLERARSVGRKIRRSWRDRTFVTKARRQATNIVVVPALSLARHARLSAEDRELDLQTGFLDHRGTDWELRCSDQAFERLIDAFVAAEADRPRSCPTELETHGVWSEWLDLNYGRLQGFLRDRDARGLRELLENIHRDPMSTGVGGTCDDISRVPSALVPAYYRSLWARHRDLLEAVRPDWSDVASPVVGNPHGAWVDGRLVQIETLEKAYYATMLLQSLATSTPLRVVEIGAGMGGQAYQTLRLGTDVIRSYTIFDLPEVATLSSYCLMAAIGEKRVRLFGEEPSGDDAIIVILPHWKITTVPEQSVDLVMNSYSFSEMDSTTSTFYLGEIERTCAGSFFHVNHETRFRYRLPDGLESVNRIGSEMVPDPAKFRLTRRKRREFVRPENRKNVAFEYLYERIYALAEDATPQGDPPQEGPRVLFLASSAGRYGSDRALAELVPALAERGCVVGVVVPNGGPFRDDLVAAGIPVWTAPIFVLERSLAPRAILGLFRSLVRPRGPLLDAARSFGPDVVYSNTSHVLDGPALARALKVRHIWHLREIERVPILARRVFGCFLLATSDRVLAISNSVLTSYFPRPTSKAVVTRDGIDFEKYRSDEPYAAPALFTGARPLRILSIGRLTPWKGQDVTVRAVARLQSQGLPVALRVVGAAVTAGDESYEALLRQESQTAGGSVEFNPEVNDVGPQYEWCDVVVHSAVKPEPFGRVVIEAMAARRLVIASSAGGPGENIDPGHDGYLIPPGDVGALADLLGELVVDPKRIELRAAACAEKAERFSAAVTTDRVWEQLSVVSPARIDPAVGR